MNHRSDLFASLRVLYVEDEPLIALDTVDGLERCGFAHLTTAMTLAEAERALEDRQFDCAILDINLDRQQTSVALGEELRSRGTKVLFASGNVMDHHMLVQQGFAFLAKPFEVSAVEEEVLRLFDDHPPTPDRAKSV